MTRRSPLIGVALCCLLAFATPALPTRRSTLATAMFRPTASCSGAHAGIDPGLA